MRTPEPIRNSEGNWLTHASGNYEVPKQRVCTLLRWVKGRSVEKNPRPAHLQAVGRAIGLLHRHAMSWKPPAGFTRRHWDWEGLYGHGSGFMVPGERVRSSIPAPYREGFDRTTLRVREVMEELGRGRGAYGLIHADIALGANVLFHSGRARPIDFDDCGFGYWVFDLAVPIAHYTSDYQDFSPMAKESLFKGYEEVQALPKRVEEHLDLFVAARYAQEMAWAQAGVLDESVNTEDSMAWLDRAGKDLKRHLDSI
ncbi:MAG: phosphotransferase [Candidatus Thorarchaeota archaeon]|nr:phosphotransferase [Candidatus Thorarchaeota archaeon]